MSVLHRNTDIRWDMKTWGFLCVLVCVLCLGSGESTNHTKPGFILTAPKLVDAGGSEYFTFTAFNVAPGGVLVFKLVNWYTSELISETTATVPANMNMWVEMQIPPRSSNLKAKLQVKGRFRDGFKIDAEKEVIIRHNSILTFVQTDKPIYKPGQTVRFRVLPMDSQLKPLSENTVGNVWIEDPSAIRIAQWNNVKFSDGIVQLELPLSNEPPFGEWSIKTLINQVSHAQKFKVEKYVLPKFEVKINPPSFVMADAESLSVEVCAWYTYGKQVDGVMSLLISYKKYEWERLSGPTVIHTEQISGCRTITMDTQELLLERREFGFRTIEIFTEVTEDGTGIKCNATTHLKISHSALKLKFLSSEDQVDYFKPGIPFYGKLSVSKPDGTPAPSEKIEICAKYSSEDRQFWGSFSRGKAPVNHEPESRVCHLFTSNKNGLVHFSIPPKLPNIRRVELQASAVNFEEKTYQEDPWTKQLEVPRTEFSLQPWFSPSGSYLQIQPIANTMDCEKLQRVRVRYTAEKGKSIKFYHQVLSRGRIVQQGSHQRTFQPKTEGEGARYDLGSGPESGAPDTAEFLLSLDPRPPMAPVARLLVFYVREDGEVVADARVFRIAHCLKNKVSLHFRHEQQYPSTESTLLLSASPSSFCGINMVDKSVRLLDPEAQFKKKNIFKALESYDVGKKSQPFQVTEDYCLSNIKVELTPDLPLDSEPDSFTSFRSSRRLLSRFPPPYLSRYSSSHVDTSMAFEEAGMVAISNFKLETRPCEERIPMAVPRRRNFPVVALEDRSAIDTSLPEMMVLEDPPPEMNKPEPEKPKQVEEVRSYFPETWLWEMHKVGPSGEMALQRPLPHTITQWVGGAVCMHPKTGLGVFEESSITAFQPFFVAFQLPYSVVRGEKLTFTVSVFNYLTECLPIKLSLDPSDEFELLSSSRSGSLCVCGGRSKTHKFTIRPLTLGEVNITVHGYSLEDDEDVLCGNEVTARLKARDAVTKQLKVEAEGFPKIEVFNYFVCPENKSYTTEVDLLLPENVVEGSARATVSVTGDIMGPALNGLQSLVRMPVGCGEQNMVLFTPNIFVLEYLTSTGGLTDEIKGKCLDHMKTGYQRELQYRHSDGSYSAFGPSDKQGSLWLTAFVVRSFGQARRYVTIDESDLNLSTTWLLSKQFENGCFEPVGTLFSDAMKGGLRDNEQSLAPMTAYVLISLLESNLIQPDHYDVQNALRCLSTELTPGTYAMALFAYVHALAKEPSTANRFLRYLEERAVVRNGHMYWSPSAEMGLSRSASVEVAGYYILAKLKFGGREITAELLPVIRWIVHQRNSNGGFVSTQDTVVALQAIASFSSLQSDSSVPLDMGLVVDNDELVKGFMLNQNNRLVTQSVQVPVLPAVLELQAVGQGCAVLQFTLRYNVEKVSGSDAFDLRVDAVRSGKQLCDTPSLGICMRYRTPLEKSNMVVLEVRMASGFAPLEESLELLESDEMVGLKRYEVNENKVNLYFETLTNEQKCFRFYMRSESDVGDIKPSMVKLYDYYKPDLEVTKEYSIPSSCIDILPDLPRLTTDFDPETSTINMEEFTRSGQKPTTDIAESVGTTMVSSTEPEINGEETGTAPSTWVTSNDEVASDQQVEEDPDTMEQFENGDNISDPLRDNFVDVDVDLDFPDGVEGNMPVTVLPPEVPEKKDQDCPVCRDGFPDNFQEIYCNSAFALRALVKEQSSGTVKIMHDLSWYLPQAKTIKKLANLEYSNGCSCPQLHTKGTLLILGSPIDLWNSGPGEQRIHLSSAVHVISTPSKAAMPVEVRTAKIMCGEDP